MTSARSASKVMPWLVPLIVTRIQVSRIRRRHLSMIFARRSSSRCSAPKPLTTALQLIASASAPSSRVPSC